MEIKDIRSETTLIAGIKLIKSALDNVIANPEIKAYSPTTDAIKIFGEETNTIILQKMREKLKIK